MRIISRNYLIPRALLPLFLLTGVALTGARAENTAYRPSAMPLNEKSTQMELTGSFWQTTSHFDNSGNEVTLAPGEDFRKIEGDVLARYGWTRQLEARAGGRYRMNSSTASSSADELTNSGFESFRFGLKYSFLKTYEQKSRFAMDAQFSQTVYDNPSFTPPATAPSNEIILGDDGNEISIGAHAAYDMSLLWALAGNVFYVIPPNDLSKEIVYRGEVVWHGINWGLLGGVKGIYSLKNDAFTNNPTTKPSMSNGATNLWNSINREHIMPFAGIFYASANWGTGFEGGPILSGTSTDKGFEAIFKLVWNSSGITRERVKMEQFKEYGFEATVTKVSPRGKFIKIDKGISHEVTTGMRIDIYDTDFTGGNTLIASGIVHNLGSDWAIVKLTTIYKDVPIKTGYTARGE